MFGKRRAEQVEGERRDVPNGAALEELTSTFRDEFVGWLDRVAQAQSDTSSAELTGDILDKVGVLPPFGNSSLTVSQLMFGQGFARSFSAAQIERRNLTAYVAAMDAEKSHSPEANLLKDAFRYWDSVRAYVESVV
jgi:hypothetical protein